MPSVIDKRSPFVASFAVQHEPAIWRRVLPCMRHALSPSITTGTAIAAVLVLANPVFGQTADPVAPPQIVAPAPAPVATPPAAVPVIAAPEPVAAPDLTAVTTSTDRAVPARSTPARSAEAVSRRAAPAAPTAARRAEPAAPLATAPVAPVNATADTTQQATPVPTSPLAPVVQRAPTQPRPTATPVDSADAGADAAGMAGAGIALLLLGGGAVWWARRRRKAGDADLFDEHGYTQPYDDREVAAPVPAFASERAYPEANRPPLQPDLGVVMPRNMPEGEELHILRERMIAQRPSEENPFLTRRNRLRRANFLIRNHAMGEQPVTTRPDRQERSDAAPVSTSAADRQQIGVQESYRFSPSARPGFNWTPRTN